MKPKLARTQTITAKQLYRILSQANKNPELKNVTKLFTKKQNLAENIAKLRAKQKEITEQIKLATVGTEPGQFLFKF